MTSHLKIVMALIHFFVLFFLLIPSLQVAAADTSPPTVSISSPPAGSSFTTAQIIGITATASDDVEVVKVEFHDGIAVRCTDPNGANGFTCSRNLAGYTPGTYSWTAIAYDAAGNKKTSAPITIIVTAPPNDTVPPTVSIGKPVTGTIYTSVQTVFFRADTTDNIAVARVEFYQGTTLKCTDTNGTNNFGCSWDLATVANGTYSWTAIAYDTAGNKTTSAPVSLVVNVVDTEAPSISLNDRVRVQLGTGSSLNVRSCASATCTSLGMQAEGNQGTVIGGPTISGAYTWWNINFDTGADGWSAEDFLIKAFLVGDLNQDGSVNSIDWSIMEGVWFTANQTADLNRDGVVNSIDFSLMNRNWGLVRN
jgi:hypothetical protein